MAAGAPNPALLQLLFSRQAAQRKEAAASQKAKIAAGIQFEKERRTNAIHKLDIASKETANLKAQIELQSLLADRLQAGEQQAEQGVAQAPLQNFLKEFANPEGQADIPGQPGFAEIAFENDPTVFNPSEQQVKGIREQALAPFNRFNARAAQASGVTPEQNFQSVVAQRQADDVRRERGVEADKASQIFTAKLEAGTLPRKIVTMRGAIDGLRDKVGSLEPGTRAFDRAADDLTAMAMGLVRLVNEGVAGSIPEARKQLIADVAFVQRSQDQVADLEQFLSVAENNSDFIGYKGQAAGIEQFFVDAGVDLRAIINNQIRGLFGDETISDDVKDTIRKELKGLLGPGDEVLAQRTTDLELLSKGIKFSLVRMNNPNRFAQAQVKDFQDFVDFKRGTSAGVIRRMKSVLASMRKASKNTLDRVDLFNRSLGLGLEGSLTITDPAGRSRVAIPGSTGTGFSGLSQTSATDFLNMSPDDQARFLQQQGGP